MSHFGVRQVAKIGLRKNAKHAIDKHNLPGGALTHQCRYDARERFPKVGSWQPSEAELLTVRPTCLAGEIEIKKITKLGQTPSSRLYGFIGLKRSNLNQTYIDPI
jgi:hypothetical protein